MGVEGCWKDAGPISLLKSASFKLQKCTYTRRWVNKGEKEKNGNYLSAKNYQG
jgi:hypothetical protein